MAIQDGVRRDGPIVREFRSNDEETAPLRGAYLGMLGVLETQIGEADLSQRNNFHHAMWLIMALGANQTAFAERHGYQPTTVSRWVNGSKAPPKPRRGPIVRDAFRHLQDMIGTGVPVPMRDFLDDDQPRAEVAEFRKAGRPVHR